MEKKFIVLLIFLLICIFSKAQVKVRQYQEADDLYYVPRLLGLESYADSTFNKLGNTMVHVKQGENCKLFDSYCACLRFNQFLAQHGASIPFPESDKEIFDNYSSAQKQYDIFVENRIEGIECYALYKEGVYSLLSKLSNAAGRPKLFKVLAHNSPVYFSLTNGNLTACVEIFSTIIPNSRKTEAQRLGTVINEVISCLNCFYGCFDNNVKYYCLSLIFESEALGSKVRESMGEALSVIVPAESITRYHSLLITQEEMMKSTQAFYSEGKGGETRKVDIEPILQFR